jgi:hypothetical protein
VLLAPSKDEAAVRIAGRELPFLKAPELMLAAAVDVDMLDPAIEINIETSTDPNTMLVTQKSDLHDSTSKSEASPDLSLVSSVSKPQTPDLLGTEEDKENPTDDQEVKGKVYTEEDFWTEVEVNEGNLEEFVRKYRSKEKLRGGLASPQPAQLPRGIKTIKLPPAYVIEALANSYILAVHPFPIVPGQLFIFSGDYTDEEGNWLVRDISMMNNWLKLISVPPQHPVHYLNGLEEPLPPYDSVTVTGFPSVVLASRGFTHCSSPFPVRNGRNLALGLSDLRWSVTHLLTAQDWEVWHKLVIQTQAIGFFQWLPYNGIHYHPLTAGCMSLLIPPIEGLEGPVPLLRLVDVAQPSGDSFSLSELPFDHLFQRVSADTTGEDLLRMYVDSIKALDLLHKDLSNFHLDCGITLLLTSNWLFVAPLYCSIGHEEDFDVYLDPLAYLGLVHLPVLQKSWPETAGSKGANDPMALLVKSSKCEKGNFIPK